MTMNDKPTRRELDVLWQANQAGEVLNFLLASIAGMEQGGTLTIALEFDGVFCDAVLELKKSEAAVNLTAQIADWVAGHRMRYWAELDDISQSRRNRALLAGGK